MFVSHKMYGMLHSSPHNNINLCYNNIAMINYDARQCNAVKQCKNVLMTSSAGLTQLTTIWASCALFLNVNVGQAYVYRRQSASFLQTSVKYLGHQVDADGLHPTDERLRAKRDMHEQTTKPETASFFPRCHRLLCQVHTAVTVSVCTASPSHKERRLLGVGGGT